MAGTTASVEVLTAEVRTLMVGSRQVTLSVYRQLDEVPDQECEPFGRVRDAKDEPGGQAIHVVGRSKETGALVRSYRPQPWPNFAPVDAPEAMGNRWCHHYDAHVDGSQKCYFTNKSHGRPVACIATEGDTGVFWHVKRNDHVYHSGAAGYWTFASDELAARAEQLAKEELADRRIIAQQHAEWSTLPLIVLAGLR